jgi:hypothetical protein
MVPEKRMSVEKEKKWGNGHTAAEDIKGELNESRDIERRNSATCQHEARAF